MPAALIDLSALMSCSLPLQVDGYSYRAEPQIEKDLGRTGTMVRMQGNGFIQATNPGDFTAAINTLAAYSQISGQNFILNGPQGSVLQTVTTANCLEGGPHIGFEILEEGMGPLYCRVRFVVEAKVIGTNIISAYKLRIETSADGLQHVTQRGILVGAGASSLFTSVLAVFKLSYSLPRWVVTYEVEYPYGGGAATSDLTTRYTISAQQLAGQLQLSGAVDGEFTHHSSKDEQQRQEDSYEFDQTLTANSDPDSTVSQARSIAQGLAPQQAQLIKESVSTSTIRHVRIRASFTFLSSADNNPLLNYTQTIRVIKDDDAYQEFTYPGVDPIAVKKPKVLARVHQSGSATGLGQFFQEPDPVMDTHEQQPQVTITDISNVEKQTSWNYEMIDVDGSNSDISSLTSQISRPGSPEFY